MLLGPALGKESLIHGRVVGVTDGDTLKVLVSEQQLLRIRLAFCDAPEKQQAFGQRAKQAMSALVFGKDVVLRQQTIDRYGRTVALVGVDGKDVGGEMLSQGLAWIYDRYFAEATTEIQEAYQKDQDEAKAGRLGLWSDPNSIPPWVFRQLANADQQERLASGWFAAHQKTSGAALVIAPIAPPSVASTPADPAQVWVNTKSGKYWNPGSLYYGKTKRGEYMSVKQAAQSGYLPANGSGD